MKKSTQKKAKKKAQTVYYAVLDEGDKDLTSCSIYDNMKDAETYANDGDVLYEVKFERVGEFRTYKIIK